MSQARTALVLGAGVGGVVAATELRRLLPKSDRVVIVDRESSHLFAPSLLWLMIGDRRPEQIARPISGLSKRNRSRARRIENIDPGTRTVTVAGKVSTSDALIISRRRVQRRRHGLKKAGHNLYTLKATGIRDIWQTFAEAGW